MERDVLVVAHSFFPWDPRIRKEVDALLAAGLTVDVVCLRGDGEAPRERRGGLRIRRLPVTRHRGSGLGTYLLEYAAFGFLAAKWVAWGWLRGRHRVVQTHTLPDPLVFVGLLPRLLGARLVLDMHELTPELFQSRLDLPAGHPAIRVLRWLERASCRVADRVITVSEPVADRLVEAGVPREKITVVMNTAPAEGEPDGDRGEGTGAGEVRRSAVPAASSSPDSTPAVGGLTLIYAGLVSDLYDLGTAVRALALLRDRGHEDLRLRVVGDGPALPALREQVTALGLERQVALEGPVAAEEVPDMLRAADVGLVPLAGARYMDYAMPTKLLEAIAAGLPVVTTRRRTIRHYFGEDALCYVEVSDAEGMAARLLELRDPAVRHRYSARARAAAWPLRWQVQAERYVGVVLEGSGA